MQLVQMGAHRPEVSVVLLKGYLPHKSPRAGLHECRATYSGGELLTEDARIMY